jgi:integrase
MKAPTSDNLHLSEVVARVGRCPSGSAIGCKLPTVANVAADVVRQFIEAATAPNTRRAYRSDFAQYLKCDGPFPATPSDIASYLAGHAGRLACSTLERRLVAISNAHREMGFEDPCGALIVRRTLRGIKRTFGTRQRRASAISIGQLEAMSSMLGNDLRGVRDRALLLVGFHGAFRRSELSAVDCKSVVVSPGGAIIFLAKGKTDQERVGREVQIARVDGAHCAIAALEAWLAAAGITEGALFRRIGPSRRVLDRRLSGEAISLIVKRRIGLLGLDASGYSGHSLRAGYVTYAVNANVPTWRIRRQTGHSSDAMLDRYIRQTEAWALRAGA